MSSLTKVNKLVAKFCHENNMADTASKWLQTEYQKQLKKLTAAEHVKDVNAPKRSQSAYLFFCKYERENVKKDKPELQATKITTELGVRWKALNESTLEESLNRLEQYKKMALDDKNRYIKEKSEYAPKGVKQGPKKSKSSYMFFCDKVRASVVTENPELKTTDITKILGKKWGELKEDITRANELQEYTNLATQDKERFMIEKQNFVNDDPNELESNKKYSTSLQPDKQNVSTEKSPVPPKSATNGYHIFCERQRTDLCKQFPDFKPKEITSELAQMWKKLSKEERTEYNDKVSAL